MLPAEPTKKSRSVRSSETRQAVGQKVVIYRSGPRGRRCHVKRCSPRRTSSLVGGPREVYVTRGLHDLRRVIPADVAFMRTSGPRQSSSRSPFFFLFFFKVLVMKPDLGIKTLPPHLSLTFTRTSTIDTPHCPPDPCRLDRRNHPALGALQVHLVLSHPGGIRTLFRSSRVFVRLKFVAIELSDSRIGRKPSHTSREFLCKLLPAIVASNCRQIVASSSNCRLQATIWRQFALRGDNLNCRLHKLSPQIVACL